MYLELQLSKNRNLSLMKTVNLTGYCFNYQDTVATYVNSSKNIMITIRLIMIIIRIIMHPAKCNINYQCNYPYVLRTSYAAVSEH